MLKKSAVILSSLMLMGIIAACSDSNDKEAGGKTSATPVEDTKPVKLNVWLSGAYTHEEFMEAFGDDIVKKYPNLSFQVFSKPTAPLETMLTSGIKLDLIQDISPMDLLNTGMQDDVSDLIKKYNFDLNTLDPVVLDTVKAIGKGAIYGFPNAITSVAMYYNKSIFDRFAVKYPTNGMTWDETYDLAKLMTRTDSGVKYQGFIENATYSTQYSQLYPGYVDPVTDKSTINNDTWKKILQNIQRFYQIPGNPWIATTPNDAFMKDKRVAMYATQLAGGMMRNLTRAEINWGVVSLPEFADRRGVGPGIILPIYYIAKTSENREWAYKVSSYMATAEYQKISAPKGGMSPLKDRDSMKDYALNDPEIPADKNVIAAVPKKYAAAMPVTLYDTLGRTRVNTALQQVMRDGKDLNTALREQDEALNKAIETEKAK